MPAGLQHGDARGEAPCKNKLEFSPFPSGEARFLRKQVGGMGIKIKYTIEEYYQDTNHTNKIRFHNLKYIEKVADLSVDALAKLIRSHGSAIEKSATELSISDLFAFVKAFDEEFHAGKQEGVDKREARKYNDYTYTKDQYDSFKWSVYWALWNW